MRNLLPLLLVACTFSKSAESDAHLAATSQHDGTIDASQSFTQKLTTGATWGAVFKFAPPTQPGETHGPLTEAAYTGQGPSVAELVGIAQAQAKEHDASALQATSHGESESSRSWWPPWWVWVALACVAAAVWKFKPGWITAAWAVVKRVI